MGINKYFRIITSDLPIQEEDVVLCKNCIHQHTAECPMYFEYGWNDYYDGPYIADNSDPDGFCNKGERDE